MSSVSQVCAVSICHLVGLNSLVKVANLAPSLDMVKCLLSDLAGVHDIIADPGSLILSMKSVPDIRM